MSNESKQHWLDRNRPPRVQITYDVETLGSSVKVELPLVVGILADLKGDKENTSSEDKLKTRKFVEIDRDNFDDLMAQLKPRLKLGGLAGQDGLTFQSLEDFHPLQIIKQAPKLNKLKRKRQQLVDIVAKLSGNDTLNEVFREVFQDKDSNIPETKGNQRQQRREPFEKALEAAKTLARKAHQKIPDTQGAFTLRDAMNDVVQAARKVNGVEGAFNILMALIPGEKNDDLKKKATDYDPAQEPTTKAFDTAVRDFKTKLASILAADAGDKLNGLTQALVDKVDAAKDEKDAEVRTALEAFKTGPMKDLADLDPVKTIVTKTTAYFTNKSKSDPKATFNDDDAVKALRQLAAGFQKLEGALQELDAAAKARAPNKTANDALLDKAKNKLAELLKDKDADFVTAADAYSKDPSQPKVLMQAIQAAIPGLPKDLDLSEATTLHENQQRIFKDADARAARAKLMEPKAREKATAARQEARQDLEAAKKIARLAEGITGALSAEPAPEQMKLLDKLQALVEELHNSAEAAAKQAQQRFEEHFPSIP